MLTEDSVKQKLIDFKEEVSFPEVTVPTEIHSLINMSREDMKRKSVEDISIDSLRLQQYALHITTQINRLKATIAWAEANINNIIGREAQNYTEFYQEKRLIIIRNDKQAFDLNEIKSLCEIKLVSLQNIDLKIEFVAKGLHNLTFSKRQYRS